MLRRNFISGLFTIFALASVASAQSPQIASLSADTLPRSGRLVILGSNFGGSQAEGDVLIGGIDAIVTQWFPDEIHAYVPESSSLGEVDVQVVTSGGGSSNAMVLEVTLREPDGRIIWHFELDRWMTTQFVEVAPPGTPAAGTIYTSDQLGLYALSPEGGLLWFFSGAGGGYAIDVGLDGTIYTATTLDFDTDGHVVAINPDGTHKWTFVPPATESNLFLGAGPNVGPDGNIYAVQKRLAGEGLGFFSLDPQGDLRWSNPSSSSLSLVTSHKSEIVFANEQLYAGVVGVGSGGQPQNFSFDFQGNEIWWSMDLDVLFHGYPRVDPFGRAVGVWGQTGLNVLEPNGNQPWFTVHPSQINVRAMPTVDSKGNIYAGADRSEMWAVSPQGEILWVLPPLPCCTSLSKAGISPDDAVIIAHHWRSDLPTAITGHDPANGAFLWLVELIHPQNPLEFVTMLYPRFSADSEVAYVTTSSGGPSPDYSRLYAIDVTDDGPPAASSADVNGDGAVDVADLLAVINAWGSCGNPDDCPADIAPAGAPNGAVDVNDLLMVISNWS